MITFRPGFHITVSTPDSTWAVTGACTVDMSQFNPSSTADSELQTVPVAGTKCFHKIAGSRTLDRIRALSEGTYGFMEARPKGMNDSCYFVSFRFFNSYSHICSM